MTNPVLLLDAAEAIAKIQPDEQGRKETRIPDLSLALTARYFCPTASTAESVTISIADTFERFAGEAVAGSSSVAVTVTLPSDQIAPISNDDFCIDGRPTIAQLRIPGIATARASLRCRSESGVSVHYASTALPLRLVCESNDDQVELAFR